MFTQCPHCETHFRIRAQEIKAAGGKVHCGRCNNVFNAIETLCDAAAGYGGSLPSDLESLSEATPSELKAYETADDTAGGEPGGAIIPKSEPTWAPDATVVAKETSLPFEVPDDLPEIEPTARNIEGSEGTTGSLLAWGTAALVLLILALGQLVWHQREAVVRHPQGRALLAPLCKQIDCRIPYPSVPEKIVILARSIASHPDRADALRLVLTFSNDAEFSQRYPDIQLSFFDSNESLVARRRFSPDVYLGHLPPTHLSPGKQIKLTMDLEDPGAQVTGFKFDFF